MRLVDKYRPKSFDEIYGQEEALSEIRNVLSRNETEHMLFSGPPGCGKTSTAECIARYKFGDKWRFHYREFNASDERGIDMVRNVLKRLAFIKGKRIIFLDEFNLTEEAQEALRRPLELSKETMFIISTNNLHKVIEPIKSRCVLIKFKRLSDLTFLDSFSLYFPQKVGASSWTSLQSGVMANSKKSRKKKRRQRQVHW